jgi:hypothetical protein
MSDAREGSLNEMENQTGSHVTLVSLAAIPRLKCGTLAMIWQAWRDMTLQYSTNRGNIVLSIICASG